MRISCASHRRKVAKQEKESMPGEVSAWFGDLKSWRMVVEVCGGLREEIGGVGFVERLGGYTS
jgi:hypothetical protein